MTATTGEPLRLMAVHAHPDDESSKGAATMARYVSEGVEVLVVTLTGGERGSVLNPKLDVPEVHANISQIRAARWIGPSRSSACSTCGWVRRLRPARGDPLPELPEGCLPCSRSRSRPSHSFGWSANFDRVMTTYDENGGYPHPDHIMCHRVSVEAFEAAGDPARYPGTGQPWEPLKLYYHMTFGKPRVRALHDAMVEMGLDSPYVEWLADWADRPEEKDRVTTRVECALVPGARRRVARSATQVVRMAAGSPFPSMRRAGCGRPRITARTVTRRRAAARGRPLRA